VSDLFSLWPQAGPRLRAAGRQTARASDITSRFWRWDKLEAGQPAWFGSATFDERVGLSHETGQITTTSVRMWTPSGTE